MRPVFAVVSQPAVGSGLNIADCVQQQSIEHLQNEGAEGKAQALYADHMALEELLIYPEAKARIATWDLYGMGREMAERRRVPEAATRAA